MYAGLTGATSYATDPHSTALHTNKSDNVFIRTRQSEFLGPVHPAAHSTLQHSYVSLP